MTSRVHASAPLSPEGRRRLIEQRRTRPIAHYAAEMGISGATASKWVNRYKRFEKSTAPSTSLLLHSSRGRAGWL